MHINILDCNHTFEHHTYLKITRVIPSKNDVKLLENRVDWFMVSIIDVPEQDRTDAFGHLWASGPAAHCHQCGERLAGNPPLRNYVHGQNPAIDTALDYILNNLATIEPAIPPRLMPPTPDVREVKVKTTKKTTKKTAKRKK